MKIRMTWKYYLYYFSILGFLYPVWALWKGDFDLFTNPLSLVWWAIVFLFPYASLAIDSAWDKITDGIKNPAIRDEFTYPGPASRSLGMLAKLLLAIPLGFIALCIDIKHRLRDRP